MIRIGLAGIGFMGRIHFLASQRLTDAKVIAVCSRDRDKLNGDWRNTRGNFGPEPGQVDLTNIAKHETYEGLLKNPDVDMVDICTVTDKHADMACQAMEAGKHVLVEKAIALTTADADRMVATAKKTGKMLMVAHVLPFFPEFQYAAETVRGGLYGKLLGAHFKRVISKPDWSADMASAAATGGPAVDLHIHDTHFIGLLCGVPKSVFATGTLDSTGTVNYLTTSYLFGSGGPSVTCSSGAVSMSGRPFVHGYEIYLEKATLVYDSGGPPLTLLTADGKSSQPTLEGGGDPLTAFANEIQEAVNAVRTGKESHLLSGLLARDALVMCHREIESVKSGRIVEM